MRRIWIFLLALILILPLAAACGKKTPETPAETDPAGDTATRPAGNNSGTEEPDYDPNILDTLPSANYGGKEFKFGLQANQTSQFNLEGPNGDQLDDAKYRWLQTIDNRYNVSFSIVSGKSFNSVQTDVLGGVDNINLYGGNAYEVYMAITKGCLRDWNSLNSAMIDLNAKRWDKTLNDSATYNGKLLAATGSLGVSKLLSTTALFYNSDLLGQYNIRESDLYELVDNYEWTLEEFETITKNIYVDKDNSNSKTDADLFGYYSIDGNSMDVWFPSFGIPLTTRDEVNNTIIPTLWDEANLEKNNGILERLCTLFHENDGFFVSDYSHPGDAVKFARGEAAMVTVPFRNAISNFAEMGSDYGLLPTPMLNSEQHAYYSNLNDQYCIWGISIALPDADLDFTAHIADALAAECSETVYYQYYDRALKNRYSKNEDVARMMDVVMSNVVFDTAMQFGGILAKGNTDITYEGYPYIPRNMLKFNRRNLSSVKAGMEAALAESLQQVYDCYK